MHQGATAWNPDWVRQSPATCFGQSTAQSPGLAPRMTWLLADFLPELAWLASSRQQDSDSPSLDGMDRHRHARAQNRQRHREEAGTPSPGGTRLEGVWEALHTQAETLETQATRISLLKPGAGGHISPHLELHRNHAVFFPLALCLVTCT